MRWRPRRPSSRPTNSWPKPPWRRFETRARSEIVSRCLPRGQLRGNGDLPGVLEPERREPPEVPAAEELGAHAVERVGRRARDLLVEDGDETGARVLGIYVDRPVLQRLEADLRARETEPALHLKRGAALQQLGETSRPAAGSPRSSWSRRRRGRRRGEAQERRGRRGGEGPSSPRPSSPSLPPTGREKREWLALEEAKRRGVLSPLSPGRWGGGWERGGWGSEGSRRCVAPFSLCEWAVAMTDLHTPHLQQGLDIWVRRALRELVRRSELKQVAGSA